jgi:hypothetical protein
MNDDTRQALERILEALNAAIELLPLGWPRSLLAKTAREDVQAVYDHIIFLEAEIERSGAASGPSINQSERKSNGTKNKARSTTGTAGRRARSRRRAG